MLLKHCNCFTVTQLHTGSLQTQCVFDCLIYLVFGPLETEITQFEFCNRKNSDQNDHFPNYHQFFHFLQIFLKLSHLQKDNLTHPIIINKINLTLYLKVTGNLAVGLVP